jgi:hypothetical protein
MKKVKNVLTNVLLLLAFVVIVLTTCGEAIAANDGTTAKAGMPSVSGIDFTSDARLFQPAAGSEIEILAANHVRKANRKKVKSQEEKKVDPAPAAFDFDGQKFEIGAKFGTIFPGEVTVDDGDHDTKAGTMFAIRAESVITPKISAGVFYQNISNSTKADDSITTNAIGGIVQFRFTTAPNLQFRPGLTLGYNFDISGDALQNSATGLEIGALVEAAYCIKDGHMITGELGFVTQPAGGNSDIDMTYGPTFYFLIGYAFGM